MSPFNLFHLYLYVIKGAYLLFLPSFLAAHSGRVFKHMEMLIKKFMREKGREIGELGLYRFLSHVMNFGFGRQF